MSALPLIAPWLALASAFWTMLPLAFPRRRRAGALVALAHLITTVALTRPWAEGWYWRDGAWLILVFGQGTLIALGRIAFELSPLGARRSTSASADGAL